MIELKNVSFKYENNEKESIKNVSMQIKKGEFVVLAGASGCGKSTVTRCLNGLIPHYYEGDFTGEILIDAVNVIKLAIHEIAESVGSVFQDPRSQFFTVNTLSELVFTCENFGMSRDEIDKRLDHITEEMGIEELLDKNIFSLSSGEKQKIALASVRMLGPKVMVLDEPSANLDYPSIQRLREVLMELKRSDYTIIVSEHRLYYLMGLMDSIYIFDEGKLKEVHSAESFKELKEGALKENALRSTDLFNEINYKQHPQIEKKKSLSVNKIGYAYSKNNRILKNLNFTAYCGDVIALVGKNGAGKTTLARILSGIYKEDDGNISYHGDYIKHKVRHKELSFVMQDADYQLFSESVEGELILGNEKTIDLSKKLETTLDKIGLRAYRTHHPATLSGGQKQRVTIAQSIIKDSAIVIMDEPTSGLDKRNMQRVCEIVRDMAKSGKTVIVITHDYEFISRACNRALYLKNGGIHEDIDLNTSHLQLRNCFEDMNKN